MTKIILGYLHSGEKVYDRSPSHIHESAAPYVQEALLKVNSESREKFDAVVDFGKVIGISNLVVTTEKDDIVFAQRVNRDGLSRLVKNRKGEPTTTLLIGLKKAEDDPDAYIVATSFIGLPSKNEPWDTKTAEERKESCAFWNKRAIIYGTEPFVPGTETTKYPWGGYCGKLTGC